MDLDKIKCIQCGANNDKISKYCSNCGNKLIGAISEQFTDIKLGIEAIIKSGGFIVISLGKFYVQFSKDIKDPYIYFEIASHHSISELPNQTQKILNLGYSIDEGGNFYKKIDTEIEQIVGIVFHEINIAFEIFNLPLKYYELTLEIDEETDKHNTPYKASPVTKFFSILIFLLILTVLFNVVISYIDNSTYTYNSDYQNTANSPQTEEDEVVRNSPWDASVYQVERYLKENLKDPKSYEGINWSDVTKLNNKYYKYMVRHKYRAKNSFGGYNIENQIFYLNSEGEVMFYEDFVE